MSLFYADLSIEMQVTWSVLIKDLKKTSSYNPYCYHPDFYLIYKHIILSLILNEKIILLDNDFTIEEIEKLTGYKEFTHFSKPIDLCGLDNLKSKEDFKNIVNKVDENWKITLYTSGTTGLPKKVEHSFETISRFVKSSNKNKENVWGFAYNPTHMAGIQVFFQAFLNGNKLVRLFGLSKYAIFDSIKNYCITHISATPTFYRLLLPTDEKFSHVERITSGGEKFDEVTMDQLKILFPNAKFTNVYASTEIGTLFASYSNIFLIKQELEGLVKIQNNELMVHKSLMGNIETFEADWYSTGDLVEITSELPLRFRFITRKSEMINVGGYKVNPEEVEEAIFAINGVKNVRVYSKKNSILGNIICCEIVKNNEDINETLIRSHLQTKLQEFKIPRMIKFVKEIIITRSGKIKRD